LYGQPGAYPPPGQPGPYSQPLQAPSAQPKRSLRWLWITLAIILTLSLLGGGALYAFTNYTAPATAAAKYCDYLKAQNYDSAYAMLSAKFQAKYTSDQFRQANTALDIAEGKVTACGAGSGSNAYKYTLFGKTATVLATTTRQKQGLLQGELGLVNSDGWKINSIATSLIGISFGALDTLGKFCQAFQTQNCNAAYALLTPTQKTNISAEEFATLMKLRDEIDGNVSACALEQITSATDVAAKVQVGLTRSTLGKRADDVTLAADGDAWSIDDVSTDLLGTDVEPLLISTTFCLAGWLGQYDLAFTFLSDGAKARVKTAAGLIPSFTLNNGAKVLLCLPDLSTYITSGDTSSLTFSLDATLATGPTTIGTFTVSMVQDSNKRWKVDNWRLN
jgi:hypothetical protein